MMGVLALHDGCGVAMPSRLMRALTHERSDAATKLRSLHERFEVEFQSLDLTNMPFEDFATLIGAIANARRTLDKTGSYAGFDAPSLRETFDLIEHEYQLRTGPDQTGSRFGT